MCGIIGRIGTDEAKQELLGGLKNLEYRGYDSAGIAVRNGSGVSVVKREGQIDELKQSTEERTLPGSIGIGHTRWSTHGPPNDANAHPHTGCEGDVVAVHNGIIENYGALRDELRARGHAFTSETDSEVVPHLIEEHLEDGCDPEEAFRRTVDRLEGSYALAVIVEDEDAIFATRENSPLVLGVADTGYYLASDVPAFLDYTNRVIYIEDGDIAVIRRDELEITDDAEPVERSVQTVDWDAEETAKGEYSHFMEKEIYTQPDSLGDTVRGRFDEEANDVTLEEFEKGHFSDIDRVVLVGCGTSYHAAMFGAVQLNRSGVPAQACLASEFEHTITHTPNTLVVAVTQSGETADTLSALRAAKAKGATTLALTNVVGSTAAREADETVFIRAGPEIGVAATKTFSSQGVTLTLLAERIADDIPSAESNVDVAELIEALQSLPEDLEYVLYTNRAAELARDYTDANAYFFIGHGLGCPVALEGALKFKEITYEHAEGFPAGELKHGPLALVTSNTPVFAILTGENDERTLNSAKEAEARGAPVVTVGPDSSQDFDVGTDHLSVPDTHPVVAGLLANVHLQLISYHTADLLDRSIDKPRNLAKSVTVE